MADAMDEGGEAAALNVLKSQHELPAVYKNSKLTKVLYNARLMVVLMRDILPLGPHFRGRRELTVPWLSKSMKVVMGVSNDIILKNRKYSPLDRYTGGTCSVRR
jgi:hypothetical protein